MQQNIIVMTVTLGLLAGCSNVGTVNGVPVGRNATVSSQSEQARFCARRPVVCVLGAALAVGIVAAAANDGSSAGGGLPPGL